ncbi:MAG: signal peptide peptidase SppA [Bacillota bacterium]
MFRKLFVVILVVLVAAGITGIYFYQDETAQIEDGVAWLSFQGPIQAGLAGFGTGVISPDGINQQLDRVRHQSGIEAVVIRIDSPGGAIGASQEIYDLIADFELPVVVSLGDMAASGGYYIAAAADRIVAQPGTMTGSIGVITTFYDPEGLLEKLGIERQTITSGEHKDMFTRNLTAEEEEMMQTLTDQVHDQFIADVARGRGLEPEDIIPHATGEIFLGSQALEYQLVDQLGGRLEALSLAGELAGISEPEYIYFDEPSLFRRLMTMTGQIPRLLSQEKRDPEIVLLERLEKGLSPVLKYQVPGF